MKADLVGAACLGEGSQKGHSFESLFDFVKSLGGAARGVVGAQGFAFALRGVVADGVVDEIAVAVGAAHDDGQVFFADGSVFELGGEVGVGGVVFGDDDCAAGVAVETVDNAGSCGAAMLAELVEVMDERAGERARPVAFGRVDDHA